MKNDVVDGARKLGMVSDALILLKETSPVHRQERIKFQERRNRIAAKWIERWNKERTVLRTKCICLGKNYSVSYSDRYSFLFNSSYQISIYMLPRKFNIGD